MAKIAVIGTTTWGLTLGIILARNGREVSVLARREEEAATLTTAKMSPDKLPGITFPPNLRFTASPDAALSDAALVIIAVPSQTFRANVLAIREHLGPQMIILSASKGLEAATSLRMSQVLQEELDPSWHDNICVLSGPNLALEIAQGMPSTTVVAAKQHAIADRVQEMVMTPNFRVYSHNDMVGVELGGALKNIIALGAGISDGWGYGANAKAAFMTRGLAEITRLGVAAGANPLTFAGLSGLGDLVATCTSRLSRNRYVGEELARGRSLQDILANLHHVAEGVDTTRAALRLAAPHKIEMPIAQQMYRVLFEGLDPRQAGRELMEREPKRELLGLAET
ncbi:MAG: NAD(P)-dependent glycerol-3-phosphate dehydrogenase [Chloroflexi bacterium]|nr:NAD(P)-dependent glycerol-3-phosphate dehydrogenase [Chloroflexota bacterium]